MRIIASNPWAGGKAFSARVRLKGMANPSSDPCADVDSVCRKCPHSFLPQDVYDLKSVSASTEMS